MSPSAVPESHRAVRQHSEPAVSAVLISSSGSTQLRLREFFRAVGWNLYEARSEQQAEPYLRRQSVQVVISDHHPPECDWREIQKHLQSLPAPPVHVVTSRLADEYLWAEVLNLGGYDVLVQPFDDDEVVRVIRAASRHARPAQAKKSLRSASHTTR